MALLCYVQSAIFIVALIWCPAQPPWSGAALAEPRIPLSRPPDFVLSSHALAPCMLDLGILDMQSDFVHVFLPPSGSF